ncbi:Sentrin-specific protease 2 [Hordeum vulgare]|nr:Sentrin-specific protease 2 [Hordeum vulgare]
MDRILNEMKEIRKDMLRLRELCAQRMIEKLNKTGVFNKTGNMEEEEEYIYGDNNESTNDGAFRAKEFVYHEDMEDYHTPTKMNVQYDGDDVDVNSHGKKPYDCTSDYWDSFKHDMSDPIEVPDVSDDKVGTSLEINEIASREFMDDSNGVDEKVHENCSIRKALRKLVMNAMSSKRVLRTRVEL